MFGASLLSQTEALELNYLKICINEIDEHFSYLES